MWYQCHQYLSMLTLAFTSKQCCAQVQPFWRGMYFSNLDWIILNKKRFLSHYVLKDEIWAALGHDKNLKYVLPKSLLIKQIQPSLIAAWSMMGYWLIGGRSPTALPGVAVICFNVLTGQIYKYNMVNTVRPPKLKLPHQVDRQSAAHLNTD